eukprot:COSAG01_NODE_67007_length_268_cov_0.781065_1_plen_72_part_10
MRSHLFDECSLADLLSCMCVVALGSARVIPSAHLPPAQQQGNEEVRIERCDRRHDPDTRIRNRHTSFSSNSP